MSDYGDEIIIKKVVSDKENTPVMRAEITVNGQKYKAGTWLWTRKDGSLVLDKAGNKQYKGKIEVDDYEAQRGPLAAPPAPPIDDFSDDDLPF